MNLPCKTCDHLISFDFKPSEKELEWIIPCRFFTSPVLQKEDEDCIGWIQKEVGE